MISGMARPRRRAAPGSGTIFERKDRPGNWIVELTVAGRRTKKAFGSRAEAQAELARLRRIAAPLEKLTLGGWLNRWINSGLRGVQEKTAITYKSIVRQQWLTQPIAELPLGEIRDHDIELAFADMIEAGWSRTTASHARAVLSRALTVAVRQGHINANPVATAVLPGRPGTPRVRQLSIDKLIAQRLLHAVRKDPTLRLFVGVLVHTGMRPGEALALRWEDISWQERVVHVRRALKQIIGGWEVGPPKTALSAREVAIPHELLGLLSEAARGPDEPPGELTVFWPTSEWLFPSPRDPKKPDNPVRVAKVLRPILNAAGLSNWSARDLRSLHASLLLRQGVDILTISKRLGHSDPATTLRRYSSTTTLSDREAADAWRIKD